LGENRVVLVSILVSDKLDNNGIKSNAKHLSFVFTNGCEVSNDGASEGQGELASSNHLPVSGSMHS